jgi:hypothetical protein
MRSLPLHACLALLLAASSALAQETTTTTTPAKPPAETTEVFGDVPATFAGRWLAVCQAKLPNGNIRPFTRLVEIDTAGGKLEVHLHPGQVPDGVFKSVEASAAKGQPWTPSPEELQAVQDGWGTASGSTATYQDIDAKLYAAPEFTPELKSDDITQSSKYALVLNETFSGGERVMRTLTVWGFDDVTPAALKGQFITTTIAAAPLPIPITLRGDSTLYRVGDVARRGTFIERVLAFFSGCGR